MGDIAKSRKIILIEDHHNLRTVMKNLLEGEGFDVVALECAEDFDDDSTTSDADAFIVDLTLPGEDGLNFVARLKRSNPTSFVVVATARTRVDDRVLGYAAGANVYLQKPVEPSELISILRSQFKIDENKSSDGILDVKRQILETKIAKISLSYKETLILSKLISAQGQFLESWQLVALFSDNDDAFSLPALQMRLSRLRQKLEDAGLGKRTIKSERGLGYRLITEITLD